MAENQACPSCLTEMPPDHLFCGQCGAKLSLEDEHYWGLRLLSAAGEIEDTLPLQRATAILGRSAAADLQIADDPTISLQHARLRVEGGILRVEDLGTMNGIFRPVEEASPIRHNMVIRAGGQWLRFQKLTAVGRSPLLSGPLPQFGPYHQPWGRLLRYGHHGKVTTARLIAGDTFTVGRTEGDMVIGKAATLSGQHFVLRRDEEGEVTVEDLGSRNGTYLQVEQGRTLNQGQSLLIGERLIRFDSIDRKELRARLRDSQPPQAVEPTLPPQHPIGEEIPMAATDPGIEPALAEPVVEDQGELPAPELPPVEATEEPIMPAEAETDFTAPSGDLLAPRSELDAQVDAAVGSLDDDDLDALLDGLPSLRD
tara:strand:+ start:333 stop:1439 length:1107 start_codon:yes stop_codon:yes gene_type:complete